MSPMECGRCGELAEPGRQVCVCGCRLLPDKHEHDLLVELLPPRPLVWACQNCLRDWDEPFCQECGMNLMPPKKPEVSHVA